MQTSDLYLEQVSDIQFTDTSDDVVTITIEKEFLKPIFSLLGKLRQIKQNLYSSDFKRRIVPFFLQKYYLWCKEHDYKYIVEFLSIIKSKKQSKQKKFELRDIQFLFQNQNIEKNLQSEIRMTWITFLQHVNEFCINDYRRIEKNKANYAKAAEVMLQEMSKPQPYERFLSTKQ